MSQLIQSFVIFIQLLLSNLQCRQNSFRENSYYSSSLLENFLKDSGKAFKIFLIIFYHNSQYSYFSTVISLGHQVQKKEISYYSIKLSADKFRKSPMSMKKILGLVMFLAISINCQNCDTGSYFDGTECQICDSRCTACSSPNLCTVCQAQAYLTIIDGGLICKLCTQIISGCAVCQSQNSCSVCLDGYSLNSAECIQKDIDGGQITIQNQVSCQSFQINLNGVCRPSIARCKDYKSDGSCNVCQDGTLLIQGYCIPSNIALSANSIQPNQNSNLNCSSRQYIQNGECVTIGDECLQFLSNGSCTKCSSRYLIYNGLCLQEPSQAAVSSIPNISSELPNLTSAPNPSQIQPQSPPSQSPAQTSSNPQCNSPCDTCSQDPQHCLSCLSGYTTVDQMPGKCFKY